MNFIFTNILFSCGVFRLNQRYLFLSYAIDLHKWKFAIHHVLDIQIYAVHQNDWCLCIDMHEQDVPQKWENTPREKILFAYLNFSWTFSINYYKYMKISPPPETFIKIEAKILLNNQQIYVVLKHGDSSTIIQIHETSGYNS